MDLERNSSTYPALHSIVPSKTEYSKGEEGRDDLSGLIRDPKPTQSRWQLPARIEVTEIENVVRLVKVSMTNTRIDVITRTIKPPSINPSNALQA
jgi:hypothetical protein